MRPIPLTDSWECTACGTRLVALTRPPVDRQNDIRRNLPNAKCPGCGQAYRLVDAESELAG